MSRALGRRIVALILAAVLASSAQLVGGPVAAAEPTFALDVSWTRPGSATVLRHPSKVRVGDTMTIGFMINGLVRTGCGATVQALPSGASMGIGQGLADTDACEAWTFVVPPPPSIGTLYIHATAEGYRDAEDVDGVSLDPIEMTLSMEAGGSRQPFTSNFPHMSWSPRDFLGASTASFGTPITFSAPPGATRGCRYAFSGDWGNVLEVRPLDYESCPSWQVTMPDLRPEPFRAGDLSTPMQSTFVTETGGHDPVLGRDIGGSMLTSLAWSPTAGTGSFDTNLPAVTFPEATTPRYAIVGQPVKLIPRIDSTPDRSYCRIAYTNAGVDPQDFVEIEQPVSGGVCEGVTVTPTVTGEIGILTQLYRADREPLGFSQAVVEVIEPMPAPTVVFPSTVIEDAPVTVKGSVGSGVPMGYSISLAPKETATTEGLALAAAAGTCATGALDPRQEETSASATCTAQSAGSYRLAVKFTDVTGTTRTTARTVSVVDNVIRLAGADRYATAAKVSANSFAPGVPVAYIATGESFPDALSAGPVAGRKRGPILLVRHDSVPRATQNELRRLKPKRIVILGGTSAIAESVRASLEAVAPVARIAGADRYETSAKLSRAFPAGVPVVYIATGTNWRDAVVAGPATRGRGPLLLVPRTSWIPTSVARELSRLRPKEIVVVGNPATVPGRLVAALDPFTDGSVTRRNHQNPAVTSAVVSKWAFTSAPAAYLATVHDFPDALAGGPAAIIAGGPMLLVQRDGIHADVQAELRRLGVDRIVVLGGTAVITDRVINQAARLLD